MKKKRLTIYDIKNRVESTGSNFFDRSTLKFFGQTLKMFSVYNYNDHSFISAPMFMGRGGRQVGTTERIFHHETNKLELIK